MAKDDHDHIRGKLLAEVFAEYVAENGGSKNRAWFLLRKDIAAGRFMVTAETWEGAPFEPPSGRTWGDADSYSLRYNTASWRIGPAPARASPPPRRIVRSRWLDGDDEGAGATRSRVPAINTPETITAHVVRLLVKERAQSQAATGTLTQTQAPDTVAAIAETRELTKTHKLILKFTAEEFPGGWQDAPTPDIIRLVGLRFKNQKLTVPGRDTFNRALDRRKD